MADLPSIRGDEPIAILYGWRPTWRVKPHCECGVAELYQIRSVGTGRIVLAYIKDYNTAPCPCLVAAARMICFADTKNRVISPPVSVVEFAAVAAIPFYILASVHPTTRAARWARCYPIREMHFGYTRANLVVENGLRQTMPRGALKWFTDFYSGIIVIDTDPADTCLAEADETDLIDIDVTGAVPHSTEADYYLKRFIREVAAIKLPVPPRQCKFPKKKYTYIGHIQWSRAEEELLWNILGIDTMAPPEFVKMMAHPFTYGWWDVIDKGPSWTQRFIEVAASIASDRDAKKYTSQTILHTPRNNPVIDVLMGSRRYGVMVLASVTNIDDLAAHSALCEYVRDTFHEWDRADLAANFDWLLATKRYTVPSILRYHGDEDRAMAQLMFADMRACAVGKVEQALSVLGHVIAAAPL